MNIDTRTRAVLIAVAAVATLTGLAGCRIDAGSPQAGSSPAGSPQAGAPQSPSAAPSAPATVPPESSAASPPPAPVESPPAHAPATDCRATDLALASIQADGGGGSAYQTVTVTSHRTTACRLPSYPALSYTDPGGVVHPLPTKTPGAAPAPMLVQPGARASFTIRTVNAYGGYDPTSPACAHPATYRNIAIRFDSGRLALTGLTLDVLCGDIDLAAWSPPLAG
jgi:hypothetical protein